MPENLYAPPQAEIDDTSAGRLVSPLWNPNAAAIWGFLLFTSIFGAFLHMKNWQALGEPQKATSAKRWVVASIAVLLIANLASLFFPPIPGSLPRLANYALFFSWYFSSGKAQATFIKARFGNDYPRRGWTKPLLVGIGCSASIFSLVVVAGVIAGIYGHRT